MKIRIFLFHRVSPYRDLLWNPMTPKLFEQIIISLKNKYEIVPLEKTLIGEYTPSRKKELCAITFDDGYSDFIEFAFPILVKHKLPSSMYVVTDCVNNNIPPWTYIINHLFIHTSHLSLDLKSKALPDSLKNTNWKTQEDRIKYVKKLSPFLKQLNNLERQSVYEQIRLDFNDVEYPENLMMDWDDVREIQNNGCEIGSHSASHPLLGKMVKIQKIRQELSESAQKIEAETGKFPLAISYPFGSYNDLIEKTAIESGYKIGLAVNTRVYNSKFNSLMEIPRIELYDESFFKAKLRINSIIGSINRLKSGKIIQ